MKAKVQIPKVNSDPVRVSYAKMSLEEGVYKPANSYSGCDRFLVIKRSGTDQTVVIQVNDTTQSLIIPSKSWKSHEFYKTEEEVDISFKE